MINKKGGKYGFVFFLIIFFICTTFIVLYGMRYKRVEGGVWVGSSRIIPYEYTLYEDYVVLNKYCGKDQEVVVPEKLWGRPVTVIGEDCFGRNHTIVSVKIPKTVVKIEADAFNHCNKLKEVIGGERVKEIGEYAFGDCSQLMSVELGNNIERIETGAFIECKLLTHFAEQDHLVFIGTIAFWSSGLEEFVFNRNAEICDRVFSYTLWQEKQPEQYIIYGEGALVCYNGKDESIIVPDDVKTVLGGCFTEITNSEIFLPHMLKKINKSAFTKCSNIRIYIPSDVEEVEEEILAGCYQVTIVTTKDSYAQQYAEEYGIPCEITENW